MMSLTLVIYNDVSHTHHLQWCLSHSSSAMMSLTLVICNDVSRTHHLQWSIMSCHLYWVLLQVFQGCGQPQMSRNKRSASSQPSQGSSSRSSRGPYEYDWKFSQKPYVRPTTAYGTSLDRLVRDIRQKVVVSKDFWKSMSHSVCNGIAAPLVDVTNCWNGLGKSRYSTF